MQTKRKSIRLKDYDYSEPGDYFVTICAQNKKCLFGEVVDCEMKLNDLGRMVEKWWIELKKKFPSVGLDEYIIMPSHLHGVITIIDPVGADLCVCPQRSYCPSKKGGHAGPPLQEIIQWFKTMTTNEYVQNVKTKNWPPFEKRLWQRNYYEHIIRGKNDLDKIRDYIISNPGVWTEDKENPNYKKQ